MSRVARIVAPGFPHHITQRGNRRADVFETEADREAYLRFLRTYCEKRGLSIWAYCLMTNHIHLVAVPAKEASMSEAMRDTHTVYAMYFNTRTQLSGHVWQGRFYSCVLDDAHLWAAVRYVETNPVRAGLVKRAEEYPWSSAVSHCERRHDDILAADLPLLEDISDWSAWLHEPFENEDIVYTTLRQRTHTGRPCGSLTFLESLEQRVGRAIRPKPRGPKPGTQYSKRKRE